MILKSVVELYFLLELKFIKCQLFEELDPEFKDINEMFPSFTKPPDATVLDKPPEVVFQNISIDLEKIDVEKFRRKLDRYKSKIADLDSDEANFTLRLNDTRRIPYYAHDVGGGEYARAQMHVVKTKSLDMALQVIYMARHKIKQLENMRYFNRHDTSYRIAFLYRKLRKIWKQVMDIWTTMRKHRLHRSGKWAYIQPYLILHHKAVMLHVDFLYMWWVLVNVHEKYKQGHYIPNTPRSTTKPTTTTLKSKKEK